MPMRFRMVPVWKRKDVSKGNISCEKEAVNDVRSN